MHAENIPTDGYLVLFRISRIPILIHWTFFVGGALCAWVLTDLSWEVTPWIIVAFTILVLVHEMGHAIVPLVLGRRIHGIVISGSGGICVNDLPDRFWAKFAYFAGGIIAQVVLLVATVAAIQLVGETDSEIFNSFAVVFTLVNAVLILVNLVPTDWSDGHQLWLLVRSRWMQA